MKKKNEPAVKNPKTKVIKIFKNETSNRMIEEIQKRNPNGTDKTWVNHVMLAHIYHYRSAKRMKHHLKTRSVKNVYPTL
jgi:hypothetical protein